MLGLRSASAVPGNTNSTTLLNSEWSKKDYILKNKTKTVVCFLPDLCCSCNQLPGQPRPDWSSRLPAHRARHLENPSENHWYRRNPLHIQKSPFQVGYMESLKTAHGDLTFVDGILSKIRFRDYNSVSVLTFCTFSQAV